MQTALTPIADWIIVLPVLLPLFGAALLIVLAGRLLPPVVAAAVVILTGFADILLLQRVATGSLSMTMGHWLPPFGISFTADGMGALFASVAALVTLVCFLYAAATPLPPASGSRFYALALVQLAGVDGALLTGDLFNLYVWFEVMLIASLGLLVFTGTAVTLDGTLKYGLPNLVGTSLFLAALGLLYGSLGTLNMADIATLAPTGNPASLGVIAALLLVAFATKAAVFPFNSWLPASYHAPPAAVSALLGGLLTKVGVYALLRTLVLLFPAGRQLLLPVLVAAAGATLLLAPLGALAETNLRRATGYLLIGGIGAALAGLCLATAAGLSGSIVYVVHAMLTIAALYLMAGETDMRRMGGLYESRPLLAALFLVLLLAVAGVPPFLGFWPKLLLLQGAAEVWAGQGDAVAIGLSVCLLLNALLTLLVGARWWGRIAWSPAAAALGERPATAAPRIDLAFASTVFLTVIVAGLGLWPEPLLEAGRRAAAGLLDPHAYVSAVGLAGGAS